MRTDQKPIQILIVGAGPTGLAAAAAATKLGLRVRIIDKNSQRSQQSKALGVHAGTLECLEKIFGKDFSDRMALAGRLARESWIHRDFEKPVRIDISTIPSRFNFVLILEQSETERFLEEELEKNGTKVERETELLSLEDRGNIVWSRVKSRSGKIEDIPSDFVIGCDGAHSQVRHSLEIPFFGDSYVGDFILGDVELTWPFPFGSLRIFLSEKGVIGTFPMTPTQGRERVRMIIVPQTRTQTDKSEISPSEFQAIVSKISQNQFTITQPLWITRFRVHHRMVNRFRKGRAFLAGDAAHIHSPAGGQGMNTGIQDAFNLVFKIHRVLSGKAKMKLLDRYERERFPVAKKVLRGTDFMSRALLFPQNGLFKFLQETVLPKAIRTRWIPRIALRIISQVAIARKEMKSYF